jgi:hypothetical protein
VVPVEIDLVGAHDTHHSLRSRGVGIAHGRSEECLRRRLPRSWSFRVHHFRGFDSRGEKANPTIDLSQPPLAVPITALSLRIEIHDSAVDNITVEAGAAVLHFPEVYIHSSEGRPAVDAGTGWTQQAEIRIGNARIEG